jgi:hypothetical protein
MIRTTLVLCLAVLTIASLLPTETADAQWVVRPWYRSRYRRGYGSGYGSYANGMANLIRAQSQAAVNYEVARSKYIDNKQKWTQNYYKMREERQAILARQHEAEKHSPESLASAAKDAVPPTLGADALDPVSGRITWPDVLKGPEFTAPRTRLDELFELRATTSVGVGNYDQIRVATSEMTAKLRDRMETLPAKQYIAGRKFLDSLVQSAQTPAG